MTTALTRRRFRALIAALAAWPHVTTAPHRFGAVEFRVGGKEFGHLHADGMLDLPLAKPLRDALVETGAARDHRWAPGTGWAECQVRQGDDPHAARLLRLSYLYRGLVAGVLGAPDVRAELAQMDAAGAILPAFSERLRKRDPAPTDVQPLT